MERGMTKEVYKMGEGDGGIQHSPGEGREEELDPQTDIPDLERGEDLLPEERIVEDLGDLNYGL